MDSFLRTIILSIERDYILKNKRQRRDHLRTIRREMVIELDRFYKKKYCNRKFKKGTMCQNLLNDNFMNEHNMVYATDYFKINICIINLSNASFKIVSEYSTDRMTMLSILDDETYLPILSTSGNHLYNSDIIDVLNNHLYCSNANYRQTQEQTNKVVRNDDNTRSNSEGNSESNSENVKRENLLSIIPNGKLEPERKYKAPQLREIAQKLNIVITKEQNGKTKNKTKKELYNEITHLLS